MTNTYLITIDNLSKAYGSTLAVQHFNLSVRAGEVVALLGRPRSGKSTILKVVGADLKPDEGFVYVCSFDTVLTAGMVRPRVGLVKHERILEPAMSGRENLEEQAMLRFFTAEESAQRIGELLPLSGLGARADDALSSYAADEWARIEMVASLLHRPQVWILDEPARGCDAAGRERVWSAFRNLRPQVSSVLLATQDEAEARALADRVVTIGT